MNNQTLTKRILVVEDEALLAEELSERLQRLEFAVVGTEDTAEGAVRSAELHRPDLVLMDIRLSGSRDGIQAADRIYRELDIPVIYLTAHSDTSTLKRARSTFPFGFLLKPLQERELLAAIEMALQRHAMERRIKESELRYSTILRSIGDGVIATDPERRVTFMNAVAEDLTGWPLEHAMGNAVRDVLRLSPPTGLDVEEHPIDVALRSRAIVQVHTAFAMIDRLGRTIPIEDSAAPILDPAGVVTGAVVAFRDCREKQANQEALREVEERLRQAERLEAIGRLAGGVAHDFNNMLTVIMGCCEILETRLRGRDTETGLLQEILGAGRRAALLTERLLAFSQQRIHQRQFVDLRNTLRELQTLLRRIVGDGVRVDLHLDAGPVPVLLDVSHFEQALVNLATNARDAMQPDGGVLEFRVESRTLPLDPIRPNDVPPGDYAVIVVRDTGCGMDEGTLARLFEPFFSTKPKGRGAGLGLATVYGTVKESGGYIHVESEPGRGTTFTIHLPLAMETAG